MEGCRMSDYYILDDDKNAIPADLGTWATFFEKSEGRRVALTHVTDRITVSTVFLGMNHQYGEGPPLIFETLVIGGLMEGEMDRCSTWAEAETMHERLVGKASRSAAVGYVP